MEGPIGILIMIILFPQVLHSLVFLSWSWGAWQRWQLVIRVLTCLCQQYGILKPKRISFEFQPRLAHKRTISLWWGASPFFHPFYGEWATNPWRLTTWNHKWSLIWGLGYLWCVMNWSPASWFVVVVDMNSASWFWDVLLFEGCGFFFFNLVSEFKRYLC